MTVPGIKPLNLSSANCTSGKAAVTAGLGGGGGTGLGGTEAAGLLKSKAQVVSPTMPSAFSPCSFCQALTFKRVPGPKSPSAFRPSAFWSFFTSSPFDPCLSNIESGVCVEDNNL